MPSKPRKSRAKSVEKKAPLTPELIQAALDAVSGGMGLRAASRHFKICKTTLWKHVNGKCKKVGSGRPPVLGAAVEAELTNRLKQVPGVTIDEMRNIILATAAEIGSKLKPDDPLVKAWTEKGAAGKKWLRGFLNRHKGELMVKGDQIPDHEGHAAQQGSAAPQTHSSGIPSSSLEEGEGMQGEGMQGEGVHDESTQEDGMHNESTQSDGMQNGGIEDDGQSRAADEFQPNQAACHHIM